MGCCDLVSDGGGIFKPVSKRCCTDPLCLLLFFIYTAAMIVVAVMGLSGGNLDRVLYPQDKYGQFCGKDAAVADRPFAYWPQLDADIQSQALILTAGLWWKFQPTQLCVPSCPKAFSLTDPTSFGGPDYPGANTLALNNNTYYSLNPTAEAYTYCLPQTVSNAGLNRALCGLPTCGNVSSMCGFNPGCTTVESDPSADGIAWSFDPNNATEASCCQFSVKEVNTQRFLPADATAETAYFETQIAGYFTTAFGVIRALRESFTYVMAFGVGAPFGFAFVWFILLFLFAGFIIIAALVLFFLALAATALYFFYKAGVIGGGVSAAVAAATTAAAIFNGTTSVVANSSDMSQMVYLVLGTLFAISALLYVIFLIVWRQAVKQCIAIVREVTKVLFALPFMTMWPAVSVFFQLAIAVYAVTIGSVIVSQNEAAFNSVATAIAGEVNTSQTAGAVDTALETFVNTDQTLLVAIMLIIHIVGCIWAYYITVCATYATQARACGVWFFSHGLDESSGEVVQQGSFFFGTKTVLVCAWCIFSRHLGSICFGAAILTIMTVIRLILEGIDYYTKDQQDKNFLLKLALKCAKCCLYCMDKTVKFITYFGFIFVAIEGSSFCGGCLSTFAFIMKYAAQMSINSLVSTILKFVISLSIPTGCAILAFMLIDQAGGYSPMWCAVTVFILAFVIASCITDVFKCCIDTIFVCSFKDLEENTPPKFMSTALRTGFGLEGVEPGPKMTTESGKASSTKQETGAEMNAQM